MLTVGVDFRPPLQHIGIEQIPGSRRLNNGPAFGPRIDQPFAGQSLHSFSDDGAADSHLLAKGWLLGQGFPGLDVATHDPPPEIVDDLSTQILSHPGSLHRRLLVL
jgi:hypothetical protein